MQVGYDFPHHGESLYRLFCLADDRQARVRRQYRFFAAVEHDDAQFFLEVFHLHTQRRLRHETFFGRQRETAVVGYGQQVFQLDDGHISSVDVGLQIL